MAALLWLTAAAWAQSNKALPDIKSFVTAINDHVLNVAPEQLYIHTDKPNYSSGDTLWFKAYLFNAALLEASAKSGVLYVEMANDSNKVIKRITLPVYQGLAAGQIVLDEEYMQGGYVLRAYTNWMRNMDEACIFKKHFYIANTKGDDWLLDYNAILSQQANKQHVELSLLVSQFDKTPVMVREMQFRLTEGRRTLLKNNVQTDLGGIIKVNFDLPDEAKTKNLTISIQDLRKGSDNRKLLVPLIFNRPANIDLQFMPEGGKLVSGLQTTVAFKAIGEDGLGTYVEGDICNSQMQAITSFKSAYKGMGAFTLLPSPGESYTARIKQGNGSYRTYPLPAITNSGLSLKYSNSFDSDSCYLRVNATPDIIASGGRYYLVGIARGMICYGASFNANTLPAKVVLKKNIFPTGVVRFIIIDAQQKPVNERLAYIDHGDQLNIKLTPNQNGYRLRDSVAMGITITNKDGQPVKGSFSVAVTDDAQVKIDSLQIHSIGPYTQLTANLKGTVETPGYYTNASQSAVKWQHLDNLLLTQGWVGYDWGEAFKPAKTFPFAAQLEPVITGRVTNAFNKPVANSVVTLVSKNPPLINSTVTNQQGKFAFRNIISPDTAVYFIQARNKNDKSFNVGIEMDEFEAPLFTTPTELTIPWYVNVDSTVFRSLKKQLELKTEQERITGGNVLKAVKVNAKKIIKGSRNLNGPGEADVVIDQATLEKAGRTSLGDLLTQHVKGFLLSLDKDIGFYYSIRAAAVHLIIDGLDIEFAHDTSMSSSMIHNESYLMLKRYFDYYDAEEIKGIEVMFGGRNSARYTASFLPPLAHYIDHSFIEVTTRSGHGPFVKKSIGTLVYRPIPFTMPKQFYAPKYKANTKPDMTAIRSTIHWEPNLVTDENGKATVSFFTSDSAGSYSIIIEGTDLNGSVGSKTGKLLIRRTL
jgi:hypothetical protein